MKLGVENLTNETANATKSTGINLKNTVTDVANVSTSTAAGAKPLAGIGILLLFAYTLYQADVNVDVSIGVLTPTTFFLAEYGWLPFPSAIQILTILTAAGLFAWGFHRYALR